MKLVRLALENWRGVASREIGFSSGVTLIEGPNEIGKSTLVEALRTLFDEMDSSNKKTVKAIQPVGQDVGSRVEAEIITGDYHIVYSKTYNKGKKTELRILEPKSEQLTGREAHERADQLLLETIDRGLWDALLVEQGKEIKGAYLAESDGLARALDEAAGSSTAEQGDSDLFRSVQAEYEQYFTLRAGKPKFDGLTNDVVAARATVEAAREDLAAIEIDSAAHQRCVAEIRRLEDGLPKLQQNVQQYQTSWEAITTLQQKVANKKTEVDTAQQLLQVAVNEQDRRKAMAGDLLSSGQKLATKSEALAPLAERAKTVSLASEEADRELKKLKADVKAARAALELDRADLQHLQSLEKLQAQKKRLKSLQELAEKATVERAKLAEIKIDAAGLELLRRAEKDLHIAIGKRDTATSTVAITAEKQLQISLNDEPLAIATGAIETRTVAAELRVAIPGVANIRITPSQSAADLEATVVEYEKALSALFTKYGVKNLGDAVATEAQCAAAARDLKSWNEKIIELLGNDSEADLQANVIHLQANCDSYTAERSSDTPLPENVQQATIQAQSSANVLLRCETTAESRQESCERLRDEYGQADADQRVAKQEVDGLTQEGQRQQLQLDEARAAESDDIIQARAAAKTAKMETLQAELTDLANQLDSASPDVAETLLTNAQESLKRADNDLNVRQRELAVLEDRLSQAQANGRFETLEVAERHLEELETRYEATTQRANAARRLWETLNKHRDATRKAYVKPLQDGIEQLGRIVFGADFSIELDDSWTLVTCTRNAITIPFEALSVGMQEQLGILTRLAAARIVSNQDGVPLIIDDALGFSDPARLETMGAAIAATGKDSQIILLTCTPGRFTHVGNAEVVRL